MKKAIRLAVTMGDPAGIGPEIIAKTADKMRREIAAGRLEFMVIGSAKALDKACLQVGLARGTLPLSMIDVGPVEGEIETGKISAVGGEWAYRAVKRAAEMVQAGEADAIDGLHHGLLGGEGFMQVLDFDHGDVLGWWSVVGSP